MTPFYHRTIILLTIAYAGAIFFLSSIPGEKIELPAPDYVMHFIEYSGLGILLFFSLYGSDIANGAVETLLFTWLTGIFYGFSDETHQYFVPGRCASIHDIAADSMGIVTASILCMFVAIRWLPANSQDR